MPSTFPKESSLIEKSENCVNVSDLLNFIDGLLLFESSHDINIMKNKLAMI